MLTNPEPERTLLSVDDLSVILRQTGERLVRHLSLRVQKGAFVVVVGQSGSGKTLTLQAILGILNPHRFEVSGRALLAGEPLLGDQGASRARGRDVAMIFQDPASYLNPLMTVGQHLDEVLGATLGLKRADRTMAAGALLNEFGFSDPARVARSYPHQLSGGEKQRASLALSLAPRPKLLLADEPTSALDATVQREVMQLIQRYREAHQLSMLMVTHDLAMAVNVADEILVMQAGQIVDRFRPGAISTHMPVEETRKLFEAGRADLRPHRGDGDGDAGDRPTALRVEALSKTYSLRNAGTAGVPALKPISFEVREGGILAIVGESGSGKTTLSRLLVGLLRPSSGAVDFAAMAGGTRARQAQLIFQDPSLALDPDRSVEQLLVETMRANRIGADDAERLDRAIELLVRVGLDASALPRTPTQFSGGQRQRIAIARALSIQPRLLICDESVSALDAHVQIEILGLLVRLRDETGLTIIFNTHDLGLVELLADEIMVLKDGELVERGPARRVLAAPQSDYTRSLVASRYRLPEAM